MFCIFSSSGLYVQNSYLNLFKNILQKITDFSVWIAHKLWVRAQTKKTASAKINSDLNNISKKTERKKKQLLVRIQSNFHLIVTGMCRKVVVKWSNHLQQLFSKFTSRAHSRAITNELTFCFYLNAAVYSESIEKSKMELFAKSVCWKAFSR